MRIRIREQLSMLVAITALTAVGVLAIVTWVHNYRLVLEVRSSRFSLTASLKSIQVAQSITLLHNTVYAISTRAILLAALRRYQLQGNNTMENWSRAIDDLQGTASAGTGGFAEVLQIVVFDVNLGNGGPGVDDGTETDGIKVGGANYTGFLPNGTRLNIGNGLGGRLGLLNQTGENAEGIILPGSAANGGGGGPMLVNSTTQQLADVAYNISHGLPFHDGFPDELYPFVKQDSSLDSGNYFTPEYIITQKGLLLGPLMVNETLYMLSFTMPIINNTSESTLLGFVTVVVNAKLVLDIITDTRGLGATGQTILVGPTTTSNIWNDTRLSAKTLETAAEANGVATHRKRSESTVAALTELFGRSLGFGKRNELSDIGDYDFRYLFPPGRETSLVGQVRKLKDYPAVQRVFEYGVGGPKGTGDDGDGGGSDLDTSNSEGRHVSVGYAIVDVVRGLADWALIIEQDKDEAFQPINKLRNILVGTVFGTFAVVVALVCPIAHFAVKPITRLKRATEKSMRPPSYTPTSNHSSDTVEPVDHDDPDPPGDEERGRNRFYGMGEYLRRRAQRRDSSQSGDGSEDQRRRAFRIPGKVRERGHLIHDELTDLTRTFNEMSEELVRQYENLEDRVAERTKELEEQKKVAEAANQAKSLFVANITHELRTPLNGILGMCAVCMQEDEVPKIKRSLGIVYKSGELLLHLLTDLLTFSRNQVGHMAISLDEKEFRMTDISTQIMAIFENQAKESRIDLGISISPERGVREMVFWGDSNRILQVLINLVSNSLKFTPEKGAIQIRMNLLQEILPLPIHTESPLRRGSSRTGSKNNKHAQSHLPSFATSPPTPSISAIQNPSTQDTTTVTTTANNHVTLTEKLQDQINNPSRPTSPPPGSKVFMFEFQVEDTGPGIPEALQQKVFEPFVQGDLRLSKKYGGTGLGLSICLQLAKLMKGTIELKSLEQAGTTFTLRIPLRFVKEITPSILSERERQDMSRANSIAGVTNHNHSPSNDSTKTTENIDGSLQHQETASQKSSESFGKNNKPRLVGLSQPFFAPNMPSSGVQTPSKELVELAARATEDDGGMIRVLVAEDNKVNQEVVLKMLKLEEIYDVTIAKDGQEAVERIKEALNEGKNFHLVLMDIQMPNLDGIESTKIIRHLGYNAPIVALTAFAEESNVKDCLDAGMNYFLAKPIRRPQLKHVLKTYCSTIREEAGGTISDVSSATTTEKIAGGGAGGASLASSTRGSSVGMPTPEMGKGGPLVEENEDVKQIDQVIG